MRVQSVSSGTDPDSNEDFVAVHEADGTMDLIVIDGGTSVADRHYIDHERGDVVWFARGVAAEIAKALGQGLSQHACVQRAAAALYEEFAARTAGEPVPLHAWPIAAMTWVRIRAGDGGCRLSLYSLGDCKTLLHTQNGAVADLDPFVNPQEAVLQAEIARLLAQGITDPAERRARMLPLLRARREAQNRAPAPSILCLQACGPFAARTLDAELPPGSALLVMTDGFYRLVEPYGLYTDGELAARCRQVGLGRMLDELRSHEDRTFGSAALAVKRADDASAILCEAD